jgi:hypothetical protein
VRIEPAQVFGLAAVQFASFFAHHEAIHGVPFFADALEFDS